MLEVAIYRPVITVYERGADGGWDDTYGAQVHTTFRPMADEDGVVGRSGRKRFVEGGMAPGFAIRAPEGSELVDRGAATFLRLPDGKLKSAIEALILAKRGESGLDLVVPGRPRPAPIAFESAARPAGPTVQLSMF